MSVAAIDTVAAINTSDVVLRILFFAATVLAGLGAGTVVNVLADIVYDEEAQYPSGRCQSCGGSLPKTRLLPLAGFAEGMRRCSSCGKTGSLRRPICSAALAVIFPLLLGHILVSSGLLRLPLPAVFVIEALGAAVLVFVFVVDLEHKLILDVSLFPAILALILIAAIFDRKAFGAMLIGLVVYAGLFLFLYGLGFLLYHTEALGLGAVKLAILIALLVGWPSVVQALVLGGLFGAAVSLLLLGIGVAGRRTYIPYGIFMATGALLALLLTPPYW
jgi:leader peptidase (prepilin peptidase)/N-methyltransferase